MSVRAFREDQDSDDDYVAGNYALHETPDTDLDAHGTTIRLFKIKKTVQQQLQSDDLWRALTRQEQQEDEGTSGSIETVTMPEYHIGRYNEQKGEFSEASLPWNKNDDPTTKFKKLFSAAVNVEGKIRESTDLSHFDSYLGMLWRLSLGAPLPYVHTHPFDNSGSDNMRFFELSNSAKGAAIEVELVGGRKARDHFNLKVGSDQDKLPFNVFTVSYTHLTLPTILLV